jgi:hypothetical protein
VVMQLKVSTVMSRNNIQCEMINNDEVCMIIRTIMIRRRHNVPSKKFRYITVRETPGCTDFKLTITLLDSYSQ